MKFRSRIAKRSIVVDMLKTDCVRDGKDNIVIKYKLPATCTFSEESETCCAKAYEVLYGMSSKTRCSYASIVKRGECVADAEESEFKTAAGEAKRQHALLWMKNEFHLICDILPTTDYTKKNYHLPKCVSKMSIFAEYKFTFLNLEQLYGEEYKPLCRSTFMKLWLKEYSYVTIPIHTAFTVCETCSNLHDRILSATKSMNKKELLELKQLRRIQLDFISEERLGYRERQYLARTSPDLYECLCMDGMDQAKLRGPHFAQVSKGT